MENLRDNGKIEGRDSIPLLFPPVNFQSLLVCHFVTTTVMPLQLCLGRETSLEHIFSIHLVSAGLSQHCG